VDIHQLQLDKVKALLGQAGYDPGTPKPGDEATYVQGLIDALCELSSRDPLTGLVNRRSLLVNLARELDRVARGGDPAMLLMVDIDHFKRVNDVHGHVVGDVVLATVAKTLQECVRPMDTVARFGGEEFAVVFPSCPPTFAQVVAERIRERVARLLVPVNGSALSLTVSCGGAFAPEWSRTTPEAWIDRADAQLYRAKAGGRNQVCIESQVASTVSAEEKGFLFGLGSDGGLMIDEPDGHQGR
jgi:diguanylate cyclase (GGDEF)-like protein